jgi:hypothetical protein
MNNDFIYIRGLKKVDHTIFAVTSDKSKNTFPKYYTDPQFNTKVAYSSGQQVKRSIIEALSLPFAAITFNWEIDKEGKAGMKEPHSPCDPSYADQLLGGYMKSEKDKLTIKRRSPLSISAMRPIHPLLGRQEWDKEAEAISYDRSAYPEEHIVKVFTTNGNGDRIEIEKDKLEEWLLSNERSLGPKYYNPGGQNRASGLFVYDLAIDLRRLFSVSTNKLEPELFQGIEEKLRTEKWIESKNIFGRCLVCPKEKRAEIIDRLAHAIINWRITSNQARTFSLMETLAIAISNNANKVAFAIRAELKDEYDRPTAQPVIDENSGAEIFLTPLISSIIPGFSGSADALDKAEQNIKEKLLAFDYENQI